MKTILTTAVHLFALVNRLTFVFLLPTVVITGVLAKCGVQPQMALTFAGLCVGIFVLWRAK